MLGVDLVYLVCLLGIFLKCFSLKEVVGTFLDLVDLVDFGGFAGFSIGDDDCTTLIFFSSFVCCDNGGYN